MLLMNNDDGTEDGGDDKDDDGNDAMTGDRVYTAHPLPTDRCLVYNNSVTLGDGGALYLAGPYANLSVEGEGTTFMMNSARNGGAIFSIGASITQLGGKCWVRGRHQACDVSQRTHV